jgi:ABC-2 type transport system permease protein
VFGNLSLDIGSIGHLFMHKYWRIFSLSFQEEFTYRLNFILWRARNLLKIVMTYFLWQGIFVANQTAFGYTKDQMTTYVLMVLIVTAIVFSAPSSSIGGEIANGNLSNYLLKPFNYLKYWFTRDIASKLLNLIFVCLELSILWIFLKPHFEFRIGFLELVGFLAACLIGMILYFFFQLTTRFVAFWSPENIWGISFLTYLFTDLLGGTIFPLDILPAPLQVGLSLTPFPYFVYYPIAIFVGKITGFEIVLVLLKGIAWVFGMWLIASFVWKKGLKNYSAVGR